MPPVQASYDNQELAWQAAPYRPRSRQRTTSLRGDSLRGERPSSIGSIHSLNGDGNGLPSISMPNISASASLGSLSLGQHRSSFTDYTSLTSPLRHGSTASSSDGSALSRAYSFLSNSTAPTSIGVHGDLLSESPEAIHSKYLLQRHHSQQEFSATTTDLHQSAGRLERSFSGISDYARPSARRQTSYGDLNSLPRGVHPDAFAPLQLDSATAQELDDEPPLTLPQPWAVERQRTNSNPYGLGRRPSLSVLTGSSSLDRSYLSSSTSSMTLGGGGAAADRLSNNNADLSGRSLPRPSLSTSLSSSTSAFHQQSVVPPDMPKSKFVEGLVGAACIAVEVVWKVPDSQGNYITPHRSPEGSSSAGGVLPLRHFIKEVLRRSKSTCSTLQCALYYIHKSRDVIRERVRAAEEAKQELIRIRASGQVDASTWNGSTLPSPPYVTHDRLMNGGSPSGSPTSTSERVAYLLAKVRDPVLCGRRMFLAALICASKFLQDKTFANKAWAKISSLSIPEINANEKALLQVLDYNLFVNPDLFRNWTRRLQDLAEKQDRKNVLAASTSSSPLGGISLQQRVLSSTHHLAAAHRDGLERSASDYLPSPAETMRVQAKPHLHSAHSASSILPRPQLTQASRFASSSFPSLQSGSGLRQFASSLGSCSEFARMGGDDWSSGGGSDNMVA